MYIHNFFIIKVVGVVSRKNIISVMITSQSRLLFTTMTGHGRTMVKKDFLSFTIRMADIRQIILLLLRLKIQILYSNKTGVYLIQLYGEIITPEDGDWRKEYKKRNSKIFKIERIGSKLKVSDIDSMKDIEAYHIDKRGSERGSENSENNKLYNEVVFPTQTGLVFLDAGGSFWWYYDGYTDNVKKFNTKQEALDFDDKVFENHFLENHGTNFNSLLIKSILIIIVLILAGIFIFVALNKKNKTRFMFRIQENERAKISRDIHDSVVQDIRGIRLETENLNVMDDSKERQKKIEDIATESIVKLRNICYTDGSLSRLF